MVDVQEDMNLHEDDFEGDWMHHYTGTDTGDETITGCMPRFAAEAQCMYEVKSTCHTACCSSLAIFCVRRV